MTVAAGFPLKKLRRKSVLQTTNILLFKVNGTILIGVKPIVTTTNCGWLPAKSHGLA